MAIGRELDQGTIFRNKALCVQVQRFERRDVCIAALECLAQQLNRFAITFEKYAVLTWHGA